MYKETVFSLNLLISYFHLRSSADQLSTDLSHAMGMLGNFEHPDFVAAIRRTAAAASSHGKQCGILLPGSQGFQEVLRFRIPLHRLRFRRGSAEQRGAVLGRRHPVRYVIILKVCRGYPAGVAELADARDSKSRDLHWS